LNPKIIIIDDEPLVAELLELIILKFYPNSEIHKLDEIYSNVTLIKNINPELIFLDIKLGKESGFDFFKYFDKSNYKIVFVTAYDNFAIEAFKVRAFDYILKPVSETTVKNVLSELFELPETNKKTFLLKNIKNDIILVKFEDVLYIEADQYLSIVHFKDNTKITTVKQLAKIQEDLNEDFFRLHKSLIVNLSNTIGVIAKTKHLQLCNNTLLPIAKRRYNELIHVIQNR
jgi:two-component system LytT family response regulator